jgi:hypothetical protein
MTKLPRITTHDFEAIRQQIKGDPAFPKTFEEWTKLRQQWAGTYKASIDVDVDPRKLAIFLADGRHGYDLKAILAFINEEAK